jgi:hypothetical protein
MGQLPAFGFFVVLKGGGLGYLPSPSLFDGLRTAWLLSISAQGVPKRRKRKMKTKSLHLVGLVLIVAVAIGATWVWAQDDGTIYYACVNNSSGTIKVFMEETPCNANEMPISWNQTGPPGPSGLSEAYATGHGDVHFIDDVPQDVLLLDLPQGNYISNITIQAQYFAPSGHGFVSCMWDKIVDGERTPLGGWTVGGTVPRLEQETFARTFGFNVPQGGGQVIVFCDPWFSGDDAEILLNYANWTVIKADTIQYQEWPSGG